MVSYYNPLAMYRHQQQSTQYSPGTAAWYPQPTQQYIPACMGDVEGHSVGTHWTPAETHKYLASHHPAFSPEWPQDCNHFQQPSPPISEVSSPGAEGLTPPGPVIVTERPVPVRSPYEWMKKSSYQSQPNPGTATIEYMLTSCNKVQNLREIYSPNMCSAQQVMDSPVIIRATSKTRTKDKYRVVYSDHQRLELEKEFHYSRYITIRRKAELASNLGLSERQVKIWFQNRRAKERKIVKKRSECPNIKKEVMENISAAVGMGIHSPLHHMQNGGAVSGGMALM